MTLLSLEKTKALWEKDYEIVNLLHELGYSEDDDDEDLEVLRNELEAIYNDGCSSGCCLALTYYSDTTAFYERNEEVAEHIECVAQEVGLDMLCDSLGLTYGDILTCSKYAKNAYVWAYVENIVRIIIEDSGE